MAEKTVMIVDDSKYITGLLEKFFKERLKFRVVATVLNGMEVLERYRELRPALVTLDISMPQKTGEVILQEIISFDPDANICIISAVRGDAMLNCMSLGAKGYIEKPLRLNDVDYVRDFRDTVNEIIG
jgi:two-component system chemotaxis response regulator CheY